MVEGWDRVCPDCGNSDGAKVARIAFHPTFQCECGYVWDGSDATLIGLSKVESGATDEDRRALANVIFEAVREVTHEGTERPLQ